MMKTDLDIPYRLARTSVTDLVDLVGRKAPSRQPMELRLVIVETTPCVTNYTTHFFQPYPICGKSQYSTQVLFEAKLKP